MDYHDNVSIARINQMVDNFKRLCCCERCANCDSSPSSYTGNYTNFSMRHILRPEFGSTYQVAYDSDGTYISENSDAYSSCDECDISSSPGVQPPISPQPVDLTKKVHRYPVDSVDDSNKWNLLPIPGRFQLEEDGYSSSDSEIAHALDLRIPRKKTPPRTSEALPAWVFCTRYSDRPSAGPRARRRKTGLRQHRTRTAFNEFQLEQLNIEFDTDQYLSESRRQRLADDLNLNEANVKIWFQNRRAKAKKSGIPHPLAVQLQSDGLYNHTSM